MMPGGLVSLTTLVIAVEALKSKFIKIIDAWGALLREGVLGLCKEYGVSFSEMKRWYGGHETAGGADGDSTYVSSKCQLRIIDLHDPENIL